MIPADKRGHRNLLIERLLVKWKRPMTMPSMMRAAGLSNATVWRYVKRMLDAEPRRAHISGWTRAKHGPQQFVAVYKRGPGVDAPYPECKPNMQSVHEYRARKRANGAWQDNLARQRARHWQTRPARRDPFVALFFGNGHAN